MGSQNQFSLNCDAQTLLLLLCSTAVRLTHRAVGSHPVRVTAAEPGVRYEGPVSVALVWALGPGQLAVKPPPARLTVALPIHTDAIVGTCGIQAIHCITPHMHPCEKTNRGKQNKQKATQSRQVTSETYI